MAPKPPTFGTPRPSRGAPLIPTGAGCKEKRMADISVELVTEAILERDQSRTADLFCQMVAREGRSVGDAVGVVTAAEAPFVQVPSHIDVRDGTITLINNDHTIL